MEIIQAHYSEALIARATKRFWVRTVGWHGFTAAGVLALLTACLIVVEGASALAIGFAGFLAFAIAVGSGVYFVYRNRALATFRRMRAPDVVIKLSEDAISTRSDLGGGDASWRAITKVWEFPEVWLLFVAKGMYFTIPTDSMTSEQQSFIRARVRDNGGKVV
jgi:hypothetical protein